MKKFLITLLFIFIASYAYSQGLDANTVLLMSGDNNHETDADTKDGSLEIMDSTGGHIITQVDDAALQTTTKKFGSAAVTLDGTGDWLDILTDSADFDITADSSSWTLSMYIKTPASISESFFFSRGSAGTEETFLRYSNSGALTFFAITPSIAQIRLDSAGSLFSTSTWYWLVVVKKVNEYGIYLDGTQVAYLSNSDHADFSTGLRIGAELRLDRYNFGGIIDDYVLEKAVLFSASPNVGKTDTIVDPDEAYEVTADSKLVIHADSQDRSGDGGSGSYHVPSFVGDAQVDTASSELGDGSYIFDGTGDRISIPCTDCDLMASTTDDWTLEVWVKSTNSSRQGIIGKVETADQQWFIESSSTNVSFRALAFDTGQGLPVNIGDKAGTVIDGNWHHLAVIKEGSDWGLYRDGVILGYESDATIVVYDGPMYLGYNTYGDFNGSLDEARMQHSNYFGETPDSGLTSSFTPETEAYSVAVDSRNRMIIIAKDINFIGNRRKGYQRCEDIMPESYCHQKWKQNFGWRGIESQI